MTLINVSNRFERAFASQEIVKTLPVSKTQTEIFLHWIILNSLRHIFRFFGFLR